MNPMKVAEYKGYRIELDYNAYFVLYKNKVGALPSSLRLDLEATRKLFERYKVETFQVKLEMYSDKAVVYLIPEKVVIQTMKEPSRPVLDYIALDNRVLVVATKGGMNDWAAYVGPVAGWNHDLEAEHVAERGTKVPYWMAKQLFPNLDSQYTWRGN